MDLKDLHIAINSCSFVDKLIILFIQIRGQRRVMLSCVVRDSSFLTSTNNIQGLSVSIGNCAMRYEIDLGRFFFLSKTCLENEKLCFN